MSLFYAVTLNADSVTLRKDITLLLFVSSSCVFFHGLGIEESLNQNFSRFKQSVSVVKASGKEVVSVFWQNLYSRQDNIQKLPGL